MGMSTRELELLPQIMLLGMRLPEYAQEMVLAYGTGMADLLARQAAQAPDAQKNA